MKQPLTNDFGMPISKDKARAVLKAAGWWTCACHHKYGGKLTLREAREEHKKQAAS
jgi:hypothetical protein